MTSLSARRPEALVAARAFVEVVDLHEVHVLDCLHDELSDSLTTSDLEVDGGIVIDQADLQLAAITRVDEARRVEACDAVLEREPAPGLHKAGIALW